MKRCLCAVLLLPGLAGCAPEADFDALRAYMDEVRQRPAPPIEPLPDFVTDEPYRFDPDGPPSPFAPASLAELPDLEAAQEARLGRRPEYLERFALDALALLRTTREGDLRAAYVRDGDGAVHRVTVGDHLGTAQGRITTIGDGTLELRERVRDDAGRWQERTRSLTTRDS